MDLPPDTTQQIHTTAVPDDLRGLAAALVECDFATVFSHPAVASLLTTPPAADVASAADYFDWLRRHVRDSLSAACAAGNGLAAALPALIAGAACLNAFLQLNLSG